jgi:arginyl-tRNA synthetase
MNEKLTLLKAVQIVLKNSLELIGVKVKEKM